MDLIYATAVHHQLLFVHPCFVSFRSVVRSPAHFPRSCSSLFLCYLPVLSPAYFPPFSFTIHLSSFLVITSVLGASHIALHSRHASALSCMLWHCLRGIRSSFHLLLCRRRALVPEPGSVSLFFDLDDDTASSSFASPRTWATCHFDEAILHPFLHRHIRVKA